MLEPVPGEDPMDTLERLAEDETSDPAAVTRNRRIAEALRELNPGLDEAEFEGGIELTDQSGVQISLYADQAAITFPYWDSLDPAELTSQIGDASKLIATETGWRLYDPQLARFTDPETDAEKFSKKFEVGRKAVRRVTSESEPKRSKWKRLLGG
jgi:hypothetical protein